MIKYDPPAVSFAIFAPSRLCGEVFRFIDLELEPLGQDLADTGQDPLACRLASDVDGAVVRVATERVATAIQSPIQFRQQDFRAGHLAPRHPCRSANSSPCRTSRGLSLPRECALSGAPKNKPAHAEPAKSQGGERRELTLSRQAVVFTRVPTSWPFRLTVGRLRSASVCAFTVDSDSATSDDG